MQISSNKQCVRLPTVPQGNWQTFAFVALRSHTSRLAVLDCKLCCHRPASQHRDAQVALIPLALTIDETLSFETAICSFTGLADYQYAATARADVGEPSVGPYGAESEPLLLVPPAFSQHDQPIDYAFRDFHAGDGRQADGAGTPGGSQLATGGSEVHPSIPSSLLCSRIGVHGDCQQHVPLA